MYTIFWIQIKLVGLQCHKTSSLAPFEPGNPARLAASAQEAVSLSKGQPPGNSTSDHGGWRFQGSEWISSLKVKCDHCNVSLQIMAYLCICVL